MLVVGCGKKEDGNTGVVKLNLPSPKAVPEKLIANPIVEKTIRELLNKLTGELTKSDLERVTMLDLTSKQLTEVPKGLEKLTQLTGLFLSDNQLTDVKGLEKLTQLRELHFQDNPDPTVAQIEELQKALPNCDILHDFTK